MGLEIYCDPCTVNSRKVLAGLSLMGVKYDYHFISYFKGEQKSESYVKNINPSATVPAAKDGDLCITESNAILQYAADAYASGGPNSAYYPADLKTRADINRWLLWESSAWFPQNYIYLVQNVVQPLLGNSPDTAVLAAANERFHNLAGQLEIPLAKTKYLCGNEPSIADIAVAAGMHVHWAQKLPLDKHSHLKRWMADIEKLPCWIETQGAVNKALGLEGQVSNLSNGSNGTANGHSTNGSVKANFNYTKDVAPQLTELYFYETEKAKGIHEPGDDPHTMAVHDGWSKAKEFTLDRNGFALSDFSTNFDKWEEEEVVRSQFYPEVVEFLKRTTGASRILVFDHTIRSKANQAKKLTQETNTSQRAPVTLVHCDYTAESGPTRVQQLLPDEAADLLSRRVAFYNVWKPIHRTVEEHPLAMCDVNSSPADDFFKLHLRYRDRDGENYVMRHADGHRWYYFPNMTPDQVILLKTYDSMTDGRARFVGHSAFEDPTSPPDAPQRESVEIRTIAFY